MLIYLDSSPSGPGRKPPCQSSPASFSHKNAITTNSRPGSDNGCGWLLHKTLIVVTDSRCTIARLKAQIYHILCEAAVPAPGPLRLAYNGDILHNASTLAVRERQTARMFGVVKKPFEHYFFFLSEENSKPVCL